MIKLARVWEGIDLVLNVTKTLQKLHLYEYETDLLLRRKKKR